MMMKLSVITKEFKKDVNVVSNYLKRLDKIENKTILITGATGLIGKMLVFSLMRMNKEKKANISIIATTRNVEKAATGIFKKFVKDNHFKLLKLDITKSVDVSEFPSKIDFVVHAAANTSSADMAHHPLEMINSVFEGTRKVLELSQKMNVTKFVYLSSMEIYGTTKLSDGVISEKFYGKIDLGSTRSSYPEAKRLAELLVLSYGKEYGFQTITLRPTQVIGSGVSINDPRVFAEFTRQAIKDHQIIMKTEGNTIRSYIYISDMVTSILHCLNNIDKTEVYNVSNEEITISIAEMAKIIADDVGNTRIKIDKSNASKRGYAPELQMRLSSKKLQATGWHPEVDSKEMFSKLIKSFEEQLG